MAASEKEKKSVQLATEIAAATATVRTSLSAGASLFHVQCASKRLILGCMIWGTGCLKSKRHNESCRNEDTLKFALKSHGLTMT